MRKMQPSRGERNHGALTLAFMPTASKAKERDSGETAGSLRENSTLHNVHYRQTRGVAGEGALMSIVP
jgi:hypothetical protein